MTKSWLKEVKQIFLLYKWKVCMATGCAQYPLVVCAHLVKTWRHPPNKTKTKIFFRLCYLFQCVSFYACENKHRKMIINVRINDIFQHTSIFICYSKKKVSKKIYFRVTCKCVCRKCVIFFKVFFSFNLSFSLYCSWLASAV